MLYDYLTNKYKPNEPIFLEDINLPNTTYDNLRQMVKNLCDTGKIQRFEQGIYYIPSASRLNGATTISPDIVIHYKYIGRNGNIDGYYSGNTFANQIGLISQVPFTAEIATNEASANLRTIFVHGRKVVLRKPKAHVTASNFRVLQLLDLLKDLDIYLDQDTSNARDIISTYVRRTALSKAQVDQYISLYPRSTYKYFYEMGLFYVLA